MRRRDGTGGQRLYGGRGDRSRRSPVEVGRAAAVRTTRRVVAMHVGRYRNVLDASEAAKAGRKLLGIQLRRSEGFENLRTGMRLRATVEQAVCGKAAREV